MREPEQSVDVSQVSFIKRFNGRQLEESKAAATQNKHNQWVLETFYRHEASSVASYTFRHEFARLASYEEWERVRASFTPLRKFNSPSLTKRYFEKCIVAYVRCSSFDDLHKVGGA